MNSTNAYRFMRHYNTVEVAEGNPDAIEHNVLYVEKLTHQVAQTVQSP